MPQKSEDSSSRTRKRESKKREFDKQGKYSSKHLRCVDKRIEENRNYLKVRRSLNTRAAL